MGKSSAPSAPDVTQTAAAQQGLNNVNQYTPFGSVVYNPTGQSFGGVPQMAQTTTLSPQEQAIFDSQMQQNLTLSGAENSLAGQIAGNYGAAPTYAAPTAAPAPQQQMQAPASPPSMQTQQVRPPSPLYRFSPDQSSDPTPAETYGRTNYPSGYDPSASDNSDPGFGNAAWRSRSPTPLIPMPGPVTSSPQAPTPAPSPAVPTPAQQAQGFAPVTGGLAPQQFGQWAGEFQGSAGAAAQAQLYQAASRGYSGATAGAQNYNPTSASANGYNPFNANAQGYNAAVSAAGPIQTQLSQQDLQGAFNQQQQSAYASQMGYLQPQEQQATAQLEDQLRQQGITQESNPLAYANAMQLQSNQQNFANQQAYNNSYQSGLAGANQLFNQGLSSGNFANSAQAQQFGEGLNNAQQINAANQFNSQAQNVASLANQSAYNAAGQFGAQAQNTASLANQSAYNAAGQFGAQAQNVANLANQSSYNAANQFGAQAANNAFLQNAQMGNVLSEYNAGQQNTMAQQNAQLNNSALTSQLAGYSQNAGLNNAANAQQYQNMFALQNQPINQLNALRGVSQVNAPQASTPNPVNYMGAVQQQYQNQLASYNNQMSGLYGLGGAGIMAYALA